MAELRFENSALQLYVTPKCGLNSAMRMTREHRGLLDRLPGPRRKVIIVRNPGHRCASFYVNKIVQQRAVHVREQLCQLDFRETPAQQASREAGGHGDVAEMSFLAFVEALTALDDRTVERHLKSQTHGVQRIEFDEVLRLESISRDIRRIHPELTITRLNDSGRARDEYGDGQAIANPYPRRPVHVPNAWRLRPAQLRAQGVPEDYRYFFDARIVERIGQRYAGDVSRFDYRAPG